MFQSLSDRLSHSLRSISGKARLTEENIQDTLREVRMALLEADVALSVVKEFVESVKQRALGQEVMKSLSPGQAFIKVIHGDSITTSYSAVSIQSPGSATRSRQMMAACHRFDVLPSALIPTGFDVHVHVHVANSGS